MRILPIHVYPWGIDNEIGKQYVIIGHGLSQINSKPDKNGK